MGIVFDSGDLEEIEEFLSAGYTYMRLNANSRDRHHYRLIQNPLGPASLDLAECDFEVDWVVDPPGSICLAGLETGTVPYLETDGLQDGYGPGDVFMVAQPDRPFTARLSRARYSYTVL